MGGGARYIIGNSLIQAIAEHGNIASYPTNKKRENEEKKKGGFVVVDFGVGSFTAKTPLPMLSFLFHAANCKTKMQGSIFSRSRSLTIYY